jgi:hypothetical protein
MKDKIIIGSVFASILAMSALFAYSPQAQAHEGFHYRGGYIHRGGCYGCGWVAPALIGGVIGYELSRPAPVIVQQPPVYVQQPTTIYVNPPGTIPPPAGYHYGQMIDPVTNQYTIVLVPN